MIDYQLLISILLCAFLSLLALALRIGLIQLGFLSDEVNVGATRTPFVSVIVAARNEEKNLESALLSLLKQDYTQKEIIVVNDRSTDHTAAILGRVQKNYPDLRVVAVTELPQHWLGKNHAHFLGAQKALGSVFLFTDADVVMASSALSKAVVYFERQKCDHLTVLPRVEVKSRLLNAVMVGFQFFFHVVTRPWNVQNPRSFAYVGIGAFNMMRRLTYDVIGTHRAIALRPDDDMQLGRLVKKKGFHSHFLVGTDLLSVEWYDSVKNLISGLMKNSFAAANYHLSLVVLGSAAVASVFVFPYVGLFFLGGTAKYVLLAGACVLTGAVVWNAKQMNQNPWLALAFPFTMLLLIYIVWRASLRTLWRGGIEWRGTFYSLKDLRSSNH